MITLEGDKTSLFQWDLNQRIIVDDPTIEQVHFSNDGIKAYVREVYEQDGVFYADIPNTLLQVSEKILVYTWDENKTNTVEKGKIKVIARAKPEDYIYSEEEQLVYKTLESKINGFDSILDRLGDNISEIEETIEGMKSNILKVELTRDSLDADGNGVYTANYTFNEMKQKIKEGYYLDFGDNAILTSMDNPYTNIAYGIRGEVWVKNDDTVVLKTYGGRVNHIVIKALDESTFQYYSIFHNFSKLYFSTGYYQNNYAKIVLFIEGTDVFGLPKNAYYYGQVVSSIHTNPGYYDDLKTCFIDINLYTEAEGHRILTLKVDANGIYFEKITNVNTKIEEANITSMLEEVLV